MFQKMLCMVVCLLGLIGCASAPTAPSMAQVPWQDAAFDYDGALVSVSRDDLFRLDPDLALALKDPALGRLSSRQRIEHLLTLLFSQGRIPFPYSAGHSTIAAETWKNKRGDCLSLSVLVFAMARAMDLTSEIQEVQVPVLFDRRDQLDFFNQHVNVLFRKSGPLYFTEGSFQPSDMVVDFEPATGMIRHGQVLSEAAILARYYNNIASEYLAKEALAPAYAHFKAAIQAEPDYAPSYSNLALLYQRAGLLAEAEQLLRHAVALSDKADVPLYSLHQLLLAQGRSAEAAQYASLLQSRRERDPYYWIGLGLQLLQTGKFRQSIQALEQAQGLSSGFEEIHRYLAVAYWRAGEQAQAHQQLALLTSLSGGASQGVAALRKKFSSAPPR